MPVGNHYFILGLNTIILHNLCILLFYFQSIIIIISAIHGDVSTRNKCDTLETISNSHFPAVNNAKSKVMDSCGQLFHSEPGNYVLYSLANIILLHRNVVVRLMQIPSFRKHFIRGIILRESGAESLMRPLCQAVICNFKDKLLCI